MTTNHIIRSSARAVTYAAGLAAGLYAARIGAAWLRYGHVKPASWRERDALLDCFVPVCDVAERHRVYIDAPAAITFAAACQLDFARQGVANAIFKARALVLGSKPDSTNRPRGLLDDVRALGWVVLAEEPGREVVLGAVTQPWEADVVFRSIPPEQFASFDEPGYVKIAWTLRADPAGERASIARTETRAVATDAAARAKFRRYWSIFSPGIVLIRWAMLKQLKRDAERRTIAPGRAAPLPA